jgi:hypothetical protein
MLQAREHAFEVLLLLFSTLFVIPWQPACFVTFLMHVICIHTGLATQHTGGMPFLNIQMGSISGYLWLQ